MTKLIIAGTGPRTLKMADDETKARALTEVDRMLSLYSKTNTVIVMSGMAEGFDELLARQALEHQLPLWCAIPTKSFGRYYWGENSITGRDRLTEFDHYISRATKITYVIEDIHKLENQLFFNGRHANFVRNDYMISVAELFLVWESRSPGTRDCYQSILKEGKSAILLR